MNDPESSYETIRQMGEDLREARLLLVDGLAFSMGAHVGIHHRSKREWEQAADRYLGDLSPARSTR